MADERSKEWVLERVKKLLTLGRNAGATDGERDNAMRMAHKLLAKYNLDMAEAEAHGATIDEKRGFIKATFYGRPWARATAFSIAELYFCEYVYVPARQGKDTTHYFFGKESNTQVASAIAAWVVTSIQKQGRKEQPAGSGNAWYRSFCVGASNMIHRRVQIMLAEAKKTTTPEPGMSLVLANVYATESAKNVVVRNIKFPSMASEETMRKGRSGKATGDMYAAEAGKKYGASINLNRQVGGNTQKQIA